MKTKLLMGLLFVATSLQAQQQLNLDRTSDAESVQAVLCSVLSEGLRNGNQQVRDTQEGYALESERQAIDCQVFSSTGMLAVMSYAASFNTTYGNPGRVVKFNADMNAEGEAATLFSLLSQYATNYRTVTFNENQIVVNDGETELVVTGHSSMGMLTVMNWSLEVRKLSSDSGKN